MPSADRSGRRLTLIGAVLGLVAATAFGVAIFFGSTPPERSFEPLGFPLLWAAPALLALLSLWERPVLLVPAAVVSFLLSFTALSGVTLVLVIPAICYGVAYHRRRFYPSTLARPLLAVVLPVLAFGGALVALVAQSDPVCWNYTEDDRGDRTYTRTDCGSNAEVSSPATTLDSQTGSELVPPPGAAESTGPGDGVRSGGGSTSDTVTGAETAASAALIAAGLAAGWAASGSGGGQAERRPPLPPRRPTDRRWSRKSTKT